MTSVADLPIGWSGEDAGHRGTREVAQEEVIMEKRYVTRLETNIKGVADYPLGRKVIVRGQNGSGKSSFVDAFSLVTTGQARSPGLGKGAEVKSKGSSDARPAYVTAETSDGEVITWPSVEPSSSIAISTWDILYGKPEALQTAILSALDQDDEKKVSPIEELRKRIKPLVPAVYHERFERDVLSITSGDTFSSALESIKSTIDVQLRRVRAQIREAKAAYENRVVPLSDDEESFYTTLHIGNMWSTSLSSLYAYESDALEEERDSLIVRGRALRRELDALKEEATHANNPGDDLTDEEELAKLKRGQLILADAYGLNQQLQASANGRAEGKCACCGIISSIAGITEHGAFIANKLAQVNTRVAELSAGTPGQVTLELDIMRTEGELNRIRATAQAVIRLMACAPDAISRREHMVSLEHRHAAGRVPEEDGSAIVERERSEQFFSLAQGVVQGVASQAVKGGKETPDGLNLLALASARVNRLLPPSIRVTIETVGSHGCAAFASIGGKPPVPFRLLGGAERALVGSAIASSFVSGPCHALVIDEVWLLRPAVTSLLSLLDQAVEMPHGPSQVILAVAEYSGTVPEGWTVIDLNPVKASPKVKSDPAPNPTSDPMLDPMADENSMSDENPMPDTMGNSGDEEAAPAEEEVSCFTDPYGNPVSVDPDDPFFSEDTVALESITSSTPIPLPPPVETKEGGEEIVYTAEMTAELEKITRIGSITRKEGQGPVPLFWLGLHKRLSRLGRERLKQADTDLSNPLPSGTLGVALVGAKRTPKIVSLHGLIVQEATLEGPVKKIVGECALVHFVSIVSR